MAKKKKTFLTLPNFFCSSRIILAIILFFLILYDYKVTALGLFVIAAITDALDGHYARKFKLSSTFGANFDGTADGILMISCLLALFLTNKIHIGLKIAGTLIALYPFSVIFLSYKYEHKLHLFHTTPLKITAVVIYITIATFLASFIYPSYLLLVSNYLLGTSIILGIIAITHYLMAHG